MQLERPIFDDKPIIVGTWKSHFKIFELNCLWNQEGLNPKQRQRFPSVGDHIHVFPYFVSAYATPRHTVVGGS